MSQCLMWLTKKLIISENGKEFYKSFKKTTNSYLSEIIPLVPSIGNSLFKSSYFMGVMFIAWYKAFLKLGLTSDEANKWIWRASENALKKIPSPFINFVKKRYLSSMLKNAESHAKKSHEGTLPEYDWKVSNVHIHGNVIQLNTYECGIQKLCKRFETEKLLPSLCRMDYLTAHYLQYGFNRDKTLGDGDDVCNHCFYYDGNCEWSPEKGFEHRK